MAHFAKYIQAKYYSETADKYDNMHTDLTIKTGHVLALETLSAFIRLYNVRSVPDVGFGTGRVVKFLKERHPKIKIIGLEPLEELRKSHMLLD